MAQLENLKDIWKNQEEEKIRFSKEDIFKMMHQKSSSVVKWILALSILEFILPLPNIFLFFTGHKSDNSFIEKYDLNGMLNFYYIAHVLIILGFIYCFFKNYKSISADTSVKSLMDDILNTRKTVKNYIYYNILMAAIIGFHMFYKVFTSSSFKESLPENTNMLVIWMLSILMFFIVLAVFWLIYRLVYGFFLKKLLRNYNELGQVD
ncbi:hypothetical protein [Namhaeicola litoreus]|uniref:Uncharacterized protein n=1 Tax=Namhaeicola litoreus TaxID=1052145 RepID=A0ABW3Y4L2_9FLAO